MAGKRPDLQFWPRCYKGLPDDIMTTSYDLLLAMGEKDEKGEKGDNEETVENGGETERGREAREGSF